MAPSVSRQRRTDLEARGADVLAIDHLRTADGLQQLAVELGRRRLTNVLVEGGRHVLGSFFQADLLQELHVFIAPKLVAGTQPAGPLVADAIGPLAEALRGRTTALERVGDDVYWRLRRSNGASLLADMEHVEM